MKQKTYLSEIITVANVISLAKGVAIVCAFFAFALSMRQIEYNRFSEIKPLFEITLSENAEKFGIKNHGGLVYFTGCDNKGAGQFLSKSPRRYSTLSKEVVAFEFSQNLKNKDSFVIYFRDVDLNAYEVTVTYKDKGFYIDGVPLAYRSKLFCSMSRKWLDCFVSTIFPKDWFSEGKAPEDDTLIVKAK